VGRKPEDQYKPKSTAPAAEQNGVNPMAREDHHSRNDLAEEHPLGDLLQIVAFVMFLILWGADSFVLKFSTEMVRFIPLYIRLTMAGVCFLLSGWLALSGHRVVFKEVRDPPRVIREGVFGHVRHPIYLAAISLYLAFFFTTFSIVSFGLLVCIVIFYDYIATFEEKQLEKAYGQAYTDYKEEVSKWIPRARGATFN